MATYTFNKVLVYGSNPGGVVRLSRNATIAVINDTTDATLFDVTSDTQGRASFATTDVPTVRLRDYSSGFESDPITAPAAIIAAANLSVSEDSAVSALVSNSGSSTFGALRNNYAALIDMSDPATTAGAAVQQAAVDAVAAAPTVTSAASAAVQDAIYVNNVSKNLYNPSAPDALSGYVLNPDGTTAASASYTTTGYIAVTAGLPYTISNPRKVSLYDGSKVFVAGSSVDNATNGVVTVTPANTGYLRASFVTASYSSTFQVEQSSSATPYEAYFAPYIGVDPDFAQAVGDAIGSSGVTVSRTGTLVTVNMAVAGKTLAQNLDLDGSSNGTVNLTGVSYDGASLGVQNDDLAPIRTQFGAVGANHGYACVGEFTNPDGKTTADLGSVWTDGTREYVLLAITGSNKLVIGGSYTSPGGVTTSAAVAPTVNLTHVSGATHTGAIVYTTKVASQLYPSVQRVSVSLWVNGMEVTGNGTHPAREVVIRETYDILDYASIYDTAKAHVGSSFSAYTIAPAVRVANTYRWTGGGLCRVSTSLTELAPTTLSQTGGVQAVIMNPASSTVTRYLPGVGVISGKDWTAGVDMTSYASDLLVTTSNLTGTQPPAFALDVANNGSTLIGFALGYLPFGVRGDEASRNARRLTNAPTLLWDLRATKKSYPTTTTNEAAGWGRLTMEAYRAYLSPAQVSTVLAAKSNALAAWDALDAAINAS